jgi:hypothetical protein
MTNKLLTSTNFIEQLKELSQLQLNTTDFKGLPVVKPTERNILKRELNAGLKDFFAALLDTEENHVANVYMVPEGIAIEIENDSIGKQVEDGNGMITLILDIMFKSLDYDALISADIYDQEQETKRKKEEERASKQREVAAKRAARKGAQE